MHIFCIKITINKIINKSGSKTEPCGIPISQYTEVESSEPI